MATVEFVCDSSELMGVSGAESPDVLVIAGFALDREKLPQLLRSVRTIKEQHGIGLDCPIKWNFRDLDRALTIHSLVHLKAILLEKSQPLRSTL